MTKRKEPAIIAGLKIGQSVVYYTGNLMRERQWDDDVDAIADRMFELYRAGIVALFQRRVAPDACEYIAMRTATA